MLYRVRTVSHFASELIQQCLCVLQVAPDRFLGMKLLYFLGTKATNITRTPSCMFVLRILYMDFFHWSVSSRNPPLSCGPVIQAQGYRCLLQGPAWLWRVPGIQTQILMLVQQPLYQWSHRFQPYGCNFTTVVDASSWRVGKGQVNCCPGLPFFWLSTCLVAKPLTVCRVWTKC